MSGGFSRRNSYFGSKQTPSRALQCEPVFVQMLLVLFFCFFRHPRMTSALKDGLYELQEYFLTGLRDCAEGPLSRYFLTHLPTHSSTLTWSASLSRDEQCSRSAEPWQYRGRILRQPQQT